MRSRTMDIWQTRTLNQKSSIHKVWSRSSNSENKKLLTSKLTKLPPDQYPYVELSVTKIAGSTKISLCLVGQFPTKYFPIQKWLEFHSFVIHTKSIIYNDFYWGHTKYGWHPPLSWVGYPPSSYYRWLDQPLDF